MATHWCHARFVQQISKNLRTGDFSISQSIIAHYIDGSNFDRSSCLLKCCLWTPPGDCTLTQNGSKYNFCVKAQRRTVYTNLDRVFTMQFLVRPFDT